MPLRRSFRFVPALATLAAALVIGACSSAPEEAATTTAAVSGPLICPAFQVKECYPGEGPGGTTLCQCVAETGPVCNPPVTETCGATLSIPPALAGCTRGMTIYNPNKIPGSADVWLCPTGTRIPTSLYPKPGEIEHIVGLNHGETFCSNCVGLANPGYFFMVRWDMDGQGGGSCGGTCSLGVQP